MYAIKHDVEQSLEPGIVVIKQLYIIFSYIDVYIADVETYKPRCIYVCIVKMRARASLRIKYLFTRENLVASPSYVDFP